MVMSSGDLAIDRDDHRRGLSDGALASRGWALFQIDAAEPRDAERFLDGVDPVDREHVRDALGQALLARSSFSVVFHTPHPVGRQRLICARATADRTGSAETARLDGVLVDITGIDPAARDALPHAQAMTGMSEARSTQIGIFLGSLTHELNQPLMAILSNAEAGLRFLEAATPDVGELGSIFREICEDNQRAVAVVRKLRNLRQGESLVRDAFDPKDAT